MKNLITFLRYMLVVMTTSVLAFQTMTGLVISNPNLLWYKAPAEK